jgi:prevent-host-death family protein
MTKTLPVSEARDRLPDLVERVGRLQSRFIITRHGRPDAVLMGHDEFESWIETLEIMNDDEELNAIREGLADLAAGRSKTFEEVFGEPVDGASAKKRKAG